jgi:ADP-ribose/FAD diphosphatase
MSFNKVMRLSKALRRQIIRTAGIRTGPFPSRCRTSTITCCNSRASTEEQREKGLTNVAHLDTPSKRAGLERHQCNFCKRCGSKMEIRVPENEVELRHVCSSCGFVDYHNPKVVVGCLLENRKGEVLLCRRALEPCKGLWTLPAGYMELGETTAGIGCISMQTVANLRHCAISAFNDVLCGQQWEVCPHGQVCDGLVCCAEGAARETFEEACARAEILAPYTHIDIPVIGQTYLLFLARLAPPYTFAPGPESQDVQFFSPRDIPFDELAFSSIQTTLTHWVEDKKRGRYTLHHGVIHKRPGASPRDPNAFQYVDSYRMSIESE